MSGLALPNSLISEYSRGRPRPVRLSLSTQMERSCEEHYVMRLRLCIAGGNSNNGSNCGSSYWNLNNALSKSNWNIGARPNIIITNFKLILTVPLGRIELNESDLVPLWKSRE